MYPTDLRNAKLSDEILAKKCFKIKIFSDTDVQNLEWYIEKKDDEGWISVDLDEFNEIIQRSYESLIKEDVVESSVEKLNSSIEFTTAKFLKLPGIAKKLTDMLVVPYNGKDEEE